MAVLMKVLCLLSLLFHVAIGQLLPFFGGGFGGNNEGSRPDFGTDYKGEWELVSMDSGVSAMHMILMPKNNKAIMFDATILGPSHFQLPDRPRNCLPIPDSKTNEVDCWAHAVEFDIESAEIRPLKVLTNPWCSSGGLAADGSLVGTGGWKDGGKSVRRLSGCATCDWEDTPNALSSYRWYATQQILPDGSFFIIGGRRQFSYEFVPTKGTSSSKSVNFPFLRETTDLAENNLYPFVHLSPDGNLFIMANNRSILLDPTSQKIVREFPVLPGGSRNYPASAMSALLALELQGRNVADIEAEVLVCGGAKPEAFDLAQEKTFLPALKDCGRIKITDPKAAWKIETMPSPRVMGDMLLLPTGDVLIITGAEQGTSAWGSAEVPNFTPVLYSPKKPMNQRFTELEPGTIPRMYHSTTAVLPDGKILVAGSNTNSAYTFKGVKYPTEMRVEKFSPPYLDPSLRHHKPDILQDLSPAKLRYGQKFVVRVRLADWGVETADVKVTMYAPPFTTHGFSMNQRLLILGTNKVRQPLPGLYKIATTAPQSATVAPPGYYLLYIVHRGVPSTGMWVHIQ